MLLSKRVNEKEKNVSFDMAMYSYMSGKTSNCYSNKWKSLSELYRRSNIFEPTIFFFCKTNNLLLSLKAV